MTAHGLGGGRGAGAGILTGAAVTGAGSALLVAQFGASLTLAALLVPAFLVVGSVGFARRPHIMVAVAIPLFAAIPVLKVFVLPEIGPLKDLVVLAAAGGVGLTVIERRRSIERSHADVPLVLGVCLFVALYIVAAGGGGHDAAWFHSVRLIGSAFLFLLVGLVVRDSQRTLRWAATSVMATAAVNAAIGLGQQLVGFDRLLALGYQFNEQVRVVNGLLRSFGTFDTPFHYALFLLIGLGTAMVYAPKRPGTWALIALLAAGVTVSFVRTAFVVLLAIFGVWLASRGHIVPAVLLVALVAAIGVLTVIQSEATQTRTVSTGDGPALSINGRVELWSAVLGPPREWPFGKGPGEVGAGVERAERSLLSGQAAATTGGSRGPVAVDSGYLATLADVGMVGLCVLLAIVLRIARLARRHVVRAPAEAWLATMILAILLVDSTTRATLTSFPSAYVALLLIGAALSAGAAATGHNEARLSPFRRPAYPAATPPPA